MLTLIAFVLTILGSINWLLIGFLQYDFIAGFFGFQASIFSRFFYILFGIGAVTLVIRMIANKGNLKLFERRKKKEQPQAKTENSTNLVSQPTTSVNNVEASRELPQPQQNQNPFHSQNFTSQPQSKNTNEQNYFSSSKQHISQPPIAPHNSSFASRPTDYYHDNLFDEHFDKDMQ